MIHLKTKLTQPQAKLGQLLIDGSSQLFQQISGTEKVRRKTDFFEVDTYHFGEGDKTLLVMPGFSDIAESFLLSTYPLRKTHNVVIVTLPGFDGRPLCNQNRYTLDNLAFSMIQMMSDLGHNKYRVFGHSLGAAVALKMYEQNADAIEHMTLANGATVFLENVDSVLHSVRRGENPFLIRNTEDFNHLFSKLVASPKRVPAFLRQWIKENLLTRMPENTRIASELFDVFGQVQGDFSLIDLSSIEVEVDLLWSDRDHLFPQAIARYLDQKIPKSRLHIIPKAGHCPHFERPVAFTRALNKIYQNK